MPLVAITPIRSVIRTQTTAGSIQTLRSLTRGNRVRVQLSTSTTAAVVRLRTPEGDRGGLSGVRFRTRLRATVRLVPGPISVRSLATVRSFLNAMPTPAPQGKLLMQTLEEYANRAQDSVPFGGGRFTRGETIPLKFSLRGVRIAGLVPTFTACREGADTPGPHIQKSSQIRLTAISMEAGSDIEQRSGSFRIESADTASLPDGRHRFTWTLKVADGNGVQHFLDNGVFEISSVC